MPKHTIKERKKHGNPLKKVAERFFKTRGMRRVFEEKPRKKARKKPKRQPLGA